jgi:hypothetical protein
MERLVQQRLSNNDRVIYDQSLLLEDLEDFRGSQHLNNNSRKYAIQRINKTVHQTVPKY